MVWEEAEIIATRMNSEYATQAVILQAAASIAASGMSEKGFKAATKAMGQLIKMLSEGGAPESAKKNMADPRTLAASTTTSSICS
jgi:hypothetical protein